MFGQPIKSGPTGLTTEIASSNSAMREFQHFFGRILDPNCCFMGPEVIGGKNTDVVNKPEHSTEGGLGPSDEVAVTRDHQLCFFSVVFRNVTGLPAESNNI